MAWLGWIVSGFLACGLGIFALMRQQQLDSLQREFKHATQAWTVQQKNDLRGLEDGLARLEVDVGREKAKTIEARIEHDRVRDEVDSLDNKVAEARRDLDAVSAEIASQDPEQAQAVLDRDAKRLESDIRRLRTMLPAMKTGSTVGGGVP